MMRTVTDELRAQMDSILADARGFFTQHAVMIPHRPRDPFSKVIVVSYGTHYWGPLAVEGQRMATKLRERYERFSEVLAVLLQTLDENTLRQLGYSRKE